MFDVGDRIIGLELPDTFYKLAELLEQDQFELLLSKNRIKDMNFYAHIFYYVNILRICWFY